MIFKKNINLRSMCLQLSKKNFVRPSRVSGLRERLNLLLLSSFLLLRKQFGKLERVYFLKFHIDIYTGSEPQSSGISVCHFWQIYIITCNRLIIWWSFNLTELSCFCFSTIYVILVEYFFLIPERSQRLSNYFCLLHKPHLLRV